MKPWIGDEYETYRILVVCESHYMPEGSTMNLDADRWYSATEDELSECERSYIHTAECVKYRLSPEGRRRLRDNAYVRIDRVVQFGRIAFSNYFYRPAVYKRSIRSVGITRRDRQVAEAILRWLAYFHRPRLIIVAAKTNAGPIASRVLAELDVQYCVVHHPMGWGRKFPHQAAECLRRIGFGPFNSGSF